jgi:crotonobetainyl-CoA:carnitine CoA-transferase CaiB-like acyl-CoA transferase
MRFGVVVQTADRKAMYNPCINNYQDRDGVCFWLVGLEGDRHWPPLARAVGHPEWMEDPRFATAQDRAANASQLIAALDEIFATKSREEWAAIFDAEEDLWWAPVQTIEEVLADPQFQACGGSVEVPDGNATTLLPATPADFADTVWAPRSMAPGHGQHSDEVLGELGRSPQEIAALRERGIVA